ncbi:MAG: PspC domain-containing protein [Roseiflexus sp.]|nr:PspC domain-containing protein [Roseiflexus sp.]MCS7290873.1 PspC domain-containing protein [Roseiflexus sp.]MDW8146300.1 PspC domain-containing protein [Roseiflexaceae bacterium]MDW8232746.1 PspC domain-containing protein [Roseiflexaceae bacterium]
MDTRTLRRIRRERILGGVAAGVARALDIDPVFVRLGFLLLALLNGFGTLLYLAMWILVPAEDTRETDPRAQIRENIADMRAVVEEYVARVRSLFAA